MSTTPSKTLSAIAKTVIASREQPRTPGQLVADILFKSPYGPMAQVMVLSAIENATAAVARMTPEEAAGMPGLAEIGASGEMWVGCAQWINQEITEGVAKLAERAQAAGVA